MSFGNLVLSIDGSGNNNSLVCLCFTKTQGRGYHAWLCVDMHIGLFERLVVGTCAWTRLHLFGMSMM